MTIAASYNFDGANAFTRGADFSCTLTKKSNDVAVDLTGLKVRAQFRTLEGMDGTDDDTLLLELADSDGIEITDAAGGEVTLALTGAQTRTLNPDNDARVRVGYGIEFYDDGPDPEVVTPFMEGKATILREVVR